MEVIDLQMEFRVTDKGPGLDPAASARLFLAFSKSKTDAVPGIGLGLFLSRRLARDLGGDLRHVSVSPGTMFVLTLPVCAVTGLSNDRDVRLRWMSSMRILRRRRLLIREWTGVAAPY